MNDPKLARSFVKLLIAVAWADGELHERELSFLEELVRRLPALGEDDWKLFRTYLTAPVDAVERDGLLEEFLSRLINEEDRQLALDAIAEIIGVDDEVEFSELEAYRSMRRIIATRDLSLLGQMDAILGGPSLKQVDDLLEGQAFRRIAEESGADNLLGNCDEKALRQLILSGGLMAHLAGVDGDFEERELEVLQQALQRLWQRSETEARYIAKAAVSKSIMGLDLSYLARQLRQLCDKSTLLRFYDMLIEVAMADGAIREEELLDLWDIAMGFNLGAADAKARLDKIPRASNRGGQ